MPNPAGRRTFLFAIALAHILLLPKIAAQVPAGDPKQVLERTSFQTGSAYSDSIHLPSDVAIVYGIDAGLSNRLEGWREHGYRTHVMTGVSWGRYQDYVQGKFDGINHEDEAQTERSGHKISHGGRFSSDVFYMCPGTNFGKFLSVGIQRALEAGADAIHLEEPEFWVRAGYEESFKREWKAFYGENWQPPHSSVDAQWRASKLKYFLYRRALQQVFDYVQAFNKEKNRHVRCYVPTHSLLNYAHWRIVSPESSLARLNGCDGYIAQIWTGTARTPNVYRGQLRERTFETAFLEYGAAQNLVRSTGRTVWFLNDPVEDNPRHDWEDYRRNWESTLVASLLHPSVWRYEVAPWPERVFGRPYPSSKNPGTRERIPAEYATELQTVMNALNDMEQSPVQWDSSSSRIGVMISDSLMFQRGEPEASDSHMSHIYGLALPLIKHGIPVEPVQLENVTARNYLADFHVILMTYHGMKPLQSAVHAALADWVRAGGVLIFWDDNADPYNKVREWWNSGNLHFDTPRGHLFQQLSLSSDTKQGLHRVGKGVLYYRAENPADLAMHPRGDIALMGAIRDATKTSRLRWKESNHLLLRRGKFTIAAGLEESVEEPARTLSGQFVNLFDPELRLQRSITLAPGSRMLLLDLAKSDGREPAVLAAACKTLPEKNSSPQKFLCAVEGIANTTAVVLLRAHSKPREMTLDNQPLENFQYDAESKLLWIRFPNEAGRRELAVHF